MAKNKSDKTIIQDSDIKAKSKKSKVKDEPLESKVSQVDEPLDDIKVDVEIDLRGSNSMQPGIYIRRKRSI